MTAEETRQLSTLSREVSALGATVTTQFDNFSNRLDSHSKKIDALTSSIVNVETYIATHEALCIEKDKLEAVQNIELKDFHRQKRGKLYDLMLVLVGSFLTFATGLALYLIKGGLSCFFKQ